MRGSAVFRTGVAPGGALAGPWVQNSLWTRARAVPSLDLRFADNKSLVDATTGSNLVTFTRASSGTYVGSDGVIRNAVTNLLLRSEEFDNASWAKNGTPTVTANSSVSPDGTTTAELFTRTTTGPTYIQQILVKAASALTYTFSVYAKQSVGNFIALRAQGTYPARADVVFNLSTGAIASAASVAAGFASASATITPLLNGWYRLTLTATTDAVTNLQVVASVNSNGGQVDGTDSVSNSACFLWGAQLEQASTVGEYIPTTSTINSAARYDHDPVSLIGKGLLLEDARTNLLLQSEDFSTTWSASDALLSSDQTTSPDGTTTADKLICGTGTPAFQGITQSFSATTSATRLSVYAKAAELTQVELRTFSPTEYAIFDLSNGTVTAVSGDPDATITDAGNGWYRCSISAPDTGVSSARISLADGDSRTFTPVADAGIYLWGAQLEAGAFPTSYIPTTTATVTRAADISTSVATSVFESSWYRQDEGTVFAEFQPRANATAGVVYLNAGSVAEATRIFYNSATSNYTFSVRAASVEQSSIILGAYVLQSERISAAYKVNDLAASRNGGASVSDVSATLPTGIDRLNLGTNQAANYLNGAIRRLTYWPTRLGNEVLQRITQ